MNELFLPNSLRTAVEVANPDRFGIREQFKRIVF